MALAWYAENATAFVQEFGLMPRLVDLLQFPDEARRIFMAKLGRIHESVLRMRAKELEKRSK